MPRHKYRFRMYQSLVAEAPEILEEARKAAQEIGLHGPANPQKPSASEDRSGEKTVDRIREVVKGRLGDDYDCCVAVTPSAALWMTTQAAFAEADVHPASRVLLPRCIAPRQKNFAVPGALIPPKYRHLSPAYGSGPQAQSGFDVVLVPLEGAAYENHGVSYSQVSLLAAVNPEASLQVLAASAEVHAPFLSGIYSQGPSTPGCGFGPLDEQGSHLLHKGLGELAAEFDVPHVTDQTFALPFLDTTEREPGTAATVYGHQAMGGLGLVIGTEDLVTPLLKASPEDLSKGHAHAGQSGLPVLLDLVSDLVENPERYTRGLSRLYDAVTEQLGHLDSEFKKALRVRKDSGSLSVEVNYEDTWQEGIGFPIFSAEDSKNGTNLIEAGAATMGLSSVSVLEASIVMRLPNPGPARFELDDERARLEVKGLVKLLEIIGKRSGYLD